MIIYTKPIDARAIEALAEAVEELDSMWNTRCCPICLAPYDNEGWDDCGCYYDLIFRD